MRKNPPPFSRVGRSPFNSREEDRIWLSAIALAGCLVLAAWESFALLGVSLFVLFGGVLLLKRKGEPPTLLLIFLYQWVQASILMLYRVTGAQVEAFTFSGDQLDNATLLSVLGVGVLAIGMRLGAGAARATEAADAEKALAAISSEQAFAIYLMGAILSAFAELLVPYSGGLYQLVLVLAALRWGGFYLYTCCILRDRRAFPALWIAVCLIELGVGIGGYFSAFKTVFIYVFLALGTMTFRATPKRIVGALTSGLVLIFLGVVWTAVKTPYREYVEDGARSQVVNVGYADRMERLKDLVNDIDQMTLEGAFRDLIFRLSYVDYFGVVLSQVPAVQPHEGGAVWLAALEYVVKPRMFFPDKPVLDDSIHTAKYTGLHISGQEVGTSISLGYVADSYIDFGRGGMMLPILGLGLVLGAIHRWMSHGDAQHGMLRRSLSTVILMPALYLETSAAKTVGGVAVALVVGWGASYFALPRISHWLRGRRPPGRRVPLTRPSVVNPQSLPRVR